MEFTSGMCGSVCDDTMLKSVQEVPKTVGTANPQVTTLDYFGGKMTYVTPEKMRYVNYNKFLKNIIFCTMGPDGHVYLKSSNPQFANIEKIKFTGVFEDFEAAAELSCDENGNKDNCDPFEKEFPIDAYLVPELIDRVLKELLGASYRPKDQQNDASDSLSQIANFIRDYVKKPLQRQIDGTEDD